MPGQLQVGSCLIPESLNSKAVNHFELYDIPVSFQVDDALVRKKFYELSKLYHPDFYVNEPQEKQDEILELSTQNNKAYHVLSNPLKRIEYILELRGLLIEGEKYTLPQDFLMDMMDVNEALMDMEFDPDPSRLADITAEVDTIEKGLFGELKTLTGEFDARGGEGDEELLLKIKDAWYRQKYLWRIRESLNKFKG